MITHKNIKLLNWFNFCLDFRIYNAIAVIYFAKVTGSFALALFIFSISTITSAVFQIPTGFLSDFFGRRNTMVVGQISSILAIVSYAIGGSFLMLAIGGVLEGLAYSLFSGNNSALLYDSLKEENQEQHFGEYQGKTSSMFQIALGISALVGSIVLGFKSFQFLFWLSVIPQVVGLFFAFQFIEPKKRYEVVGKSMIVHLKESLKKFKKNAKLRNLSLASILGYGIGESFFQFSPAFFATLWPPWAIALSRFLSNSFAAIGYRVAGKLIRKFGELKTLIWGNSADFIIGTAIIAYPTVMTPLINSLTSFGYGVGSTAQSSLLQKEFSDEQRATMGSLNSLAGSLFFGVFAFALGLWADRVGPRYAILTAQLLSIFVLILYWKLFKNHNKAKKIS